MTHPSELVSLEDSIIARICRMAGPGVILASLPSSRLHCIWQATVETLDTNYEDVNEHDLVIISKYINLQRLTLKRTKRQQQQAGQQCSLPPWYVIGALSPALHKLCHLKIAQTGAFEAVKVIFAHEPLRDRILSICLSDDQHSVSMEELFALASMPKLQHLGLECTSIATDADAVTAAAARMQQLNALEISCHGPGAMHFILTAALKRLTHLRLNGREAHVSTFHQQQLLAAAVSGLNNLQHLETNYPLSSRQAQEEALSHLTRLSSLMLMGPALPLPQRAHPVLVMLPQLQQLEQLRCPQHRVRWSDVATHPTLAYLECSTLKQAQAAQLQHNESAHQEHRTTPGSGGSSRSIRSSKSSNSGGNVAISTCRLRCLQLHHAADEDLAGLPRMHLLQELTLAIVPGSSSGRYRHLAALLWRHAASLQQISVRGEPFAELLPEQLPKLRSLQLTVPAGALLAMGACSMPLLEDLDLVIGLEQQAQGLLQWAAPQVQLMPQLAWLPQLQRLQNLALYNVGLPLLEQARSMLAAAGIRCVVDGV